MQAGDQHFPQLHSNTKTIQVTLISDIKSTLLVHQLNYDLKKFTLNSNFKKISPIRD